MAYIGPDPDPNRHNTTATISIRSGIAIDGGNGVDSRKEQIIPNPLQEEIFITIVCVGYNCTLPATSGKQLKYTLRVNTLNRAV